MWTREEMLADRVRLRGTTAEDGPAMARLHRRAIDQAHDVGVSALDHEFGPDRVEPRSSRIDTKGEEISIVGEVARETVGFVSFVACGSVGEITRLYVDPDWQQQGVGRRLSERAEAILRGHGAECACVRSSPAGVAAFRALGYVETKPTTDATFGGCEPTSVKMEKALGGDWRNFYGRRHGKSLRPAQKTALHQLADLSPGVVTPEDNPERRPLDISQFEGRPLWLEIGFGGGEHLVHQAESNPGVQLIGAEPFVNGVAMLLAKIAAAGVTNISVHAGDVRDVIELLPDASISRAFLLYPDPWPKRRHHRRRFVTAGYLAPLARVLTPGAEFRIATDIPDYVRQAREEVPRHGFRDATSDSAVAWPDWTRTRYEAKALREGRRPHYLTYMRS